MNIVATMIYVSYYLDIFREKRTPIGRYSIIIHVHTIYGGVIKHARQSHDQRDIRWSSSMFKLGFSKGYIDHKMYFFF